MVQSHDLRLGIVENRGLRGQEWRTECTANRWQQAESLKAPTLIRMGILRRKATNFLSYGVSAELSPKTLEFHRIRRRSPVFLIIEDARYEYRDNYT